MTIRLEEGKRDLIRAQERLRIESNRMKLYQVVSRTDQQIAKAQVSAAREALKALDEQKVEEDVFFDVISSFQEVGNKDSEWYEMYLIIFPILTFIILCLGYFLKKSVLFVKNYE